MHPAMLSKGLSRAPWPPFGRRPGITRFPSSWGDYRQALVNLDPKYTLSRGGSTLDWQAYLVQNPGAQRMAFDALLEASREIDARCGTNLMGFAWDNFVHGRFETYP
jgi:hypothetical protein